MRGEAKEQLFPLSTRAPKVIGYMANPSTIEVKADIARNQLSQLAHNAIISCLRGASYRCCSRAVQPARAQFYHIPHVRPFSVVLMKA